MQPSLTTCFEAIKSVVFQQDMETTTITSKEKETTDFVEGIYPEGNLEQWLRDVESCMFTTVRNQTVHSLDDYSKIPHTQSVSSWSRQVMLAVV